MVLNLYPCIPYNYNVVKLLTLAYRINMKYDFPSPLIKGYFLKRHNRFVAEMRLENGDSVMVHSSNTGSMKGLLEPESPVILWDSQNPKRKYPLSWKAVKPGASWVGIDTILPNHLAKILVETNAIEGLTGFNKVLSEQNIGNSTRIDLVGMGSEKTCFIEVKNVTLVKNGIAKFPDAVTKRGAKHLNELVRKIEEGNRGAMIYMIQRNDATSFEPEWKIDPHYGNTLFNAIEKGVEVYPLLMEVSPTGVTYLRTVQFNVVRPIEPLFI
jgi:sugar fermentation stimulation protein A